MPFSIDIRLVFAGCLTVLLLLGAITSAQATDPPSTSPASEQSPPAQGDVQERGVYPDRAAQFGGTMQVVPMNPSGPVGFSCDPKTHICTCRLSKSNDCDLMNAVACGTVITCPGSSQTCTCQSRK